MFNRRLIITGLHNMIKTLNALQVRFKGRRRGSALCTSYLFFFPPRFSRIVYYLWHYDSVRWYSLTWGLDLFSTVVFFFFLPTGGWRRRRLSGADRDIFPQQAHAKSCKEPAGRRRCPMSGVCARTLSKWRRGCRRSQGPLRDRRQHLCRIRRRAVRDWYHRKSGGEPQTRLCAEIEWCRIVKLD